MEHPVELEAHEYAQLFPLLVGDEYIALRDDIHANGQHELIVLFEGKILDGRNRYSACIDLQQPPQITHFEGTSDEALEFVLSKNLYRRQLSVAQRALVAASMSALRKEQQAAASSGAHAPLDVEAAAKLLRVSPRSVSSACKVVRDGSPALQEEVKRGRVTISAAELVAKLPEDEQQMLCGKGPGAIRKAAKELRGPSQGKAKDKAESQEEKSPSIQGAIDGLPWDQELPEVIDQDDIRSSTQPHHEKRQSPAIRLFEIAVEQGEEGVDLDAMVDEILAAASDADIEWLKFAAEIAGRIQQKLEVDDIED